MFRSFCLYGVLILVISSGCNPASQIKKFTPPEDEYIATNYIAELRQGKFDRILNDFDPILKSALTQNVLTEMQQSIPSQDPISIKVIGAYQIREPNLYKINLSFEYQFPSEWLLINVATQKKNGVLTIVGFNIYPREDSLEHLNRFTLHGKSFLQYAMLAFAALVPALILVALILCFRTKIEKRKWLWIIFILIGLGKFTINWTSGQWSFSPIYILLFGSGAFAPPYGEWSVSTSLPLGAILFLLHRRRLHPPH